MAWLPCFTKGISKEKLEQDAFYAGVLYGVHENWSLEKSLLTGTCAATACSRSTCPMDYAPSMSALLLQKVWNWGRRSLKDFSSLSSGSFSEIKVSIL